MYFYIGYSNILSKSNKLKEKEMNKDALIKLMFKTFSIMVERTFLLVQGSWEKEIPDLRSRMEVGDEAKFWVSMAMTDNIVVKFCEKPCEQERDFIMDACFLYLESLFTQHDPSARLKAVEDFCLSRYVDCKSV